MSRAIGIDGYLPGVDDPAAKVSLTRARHRNLTPSQRRGIAAMRQAAAEADREAVASIFSMRTKPSQQPISSTPTTHVSTLRLPMPQPPAQDPVVVTGNWPPPYLGLFMLILAFVAVGGVVVGAKVAQRTEWASPSGIVDESGVDAAVEPAPAGWR